VEPAPVTPPIPAAPSPPTSERGQNAFTRWFKQRRHGLNRHLAKYSLVGDNPTYDTANFPWLQPLLAAVPQIREEAKSIIRHSESIPPFRDFAHGRLRFGTNDWRSFFFYGYGYPIEENLARCPIVADALKRVPGLVSAIFSVLGPDAHITRHSGLSKAILTAHIGLIVPREAERCRMDVAGTNVVWQEGQAWIFDDTCEHEVWNDTEEVRVLLLLQFRRPMRQPGKIFADLLVGLVRRSSFIQRARRNLDYWEDAFAQAECSENVSLN